jgi:hypothetical protein
MKTKGIGPNNLGAPKGVGKMMYSPAKLEKGKKGKKPDYRKAETFNNYENAQAKFENFNPGSDTLFVSTSIDPGMASKKSSFQGRVSASKGASGSMPSDEKMFKTKNASGQSTYTNVKVYKKK